MPLSSRESAQPIVMEEAREKQSGFDLRSSLDAALVGGVGS